MTSSSRPLAERERAALADLLEELGPDAPTCCEGWTTAHLAAHLGGSLLELGHLHLRPL